MACTAYAPDLTARDRARFLYEAIPPDLFKVENEGDRIPWRISPEPFALSSRTLADIEQIGNDLLVFYRALNNLYNRSARGTAPAFIAEYLDQGKPEHIVRLARQNRFKQELPLVIRPDLILTEDGFTASELDSVPGGMGFVGAMTEAYCKLGMESAGGANGIPNGFAAMIKAATGKDSPRTAIVVSDESGDYRAELRWLAGALDRLGLLTAHVCAPQDLVFTEEAMFVRLEDGKEEKIDALYRNFELFDLMNVPKQELMLYAARHNRVKMTPPPKAHLEEKLSFALFHHFALEKLWQAEMGKDVFARLKRIFPQTWVLDPRPLPAQAAIHGLQASGIPVTDWMQLAELGKSERDYVIKPSGFSELAWGSRGVRVANDLPKEEWIATISEALDQYAKTPRILQRFHKGKRVRQNYFDRKADDVRGFEGRV
ncbi:MAG: hypothetical protein ABR508_02240, partial [Candidatus Baltobacteraceae bacterium]